MAVAQVFGTTRSENKRRIAEKSLQSFRPWSRGRASPRFCMVEIFRAKKPPESIPSTVKRNTSCGVQFFNGDDLRFRPMPELASIVRPKISATSFMECQELQSSRARRICPAWPRPPALPDNVIARLVRFVVTIDVEPGYGAVPSR
jgi:hypothetical protein